ncbi:MAG: hypothetical protein IH588_17870 [Anaerolineales bacterium]|nr:hypothetical protein [Anaerolineales bacterium]
MAGFFKTSLKNRRKTIASFFAAMAIAGVILFSSFVYPPSEAEAQFFLGLSRIRFVMAFLFLGLLLANIGLTYIFLEKRWDWQNRFEEKLGLLISGKLSLVFAILYISMAATGTLLLLTIPPIPVSLVFLEPIRLRLLDLVAWLFLCSSLLIVLFRLLYAERVRSEVFFQKLDQGLLVASIFLFTFFFYEHFAAWIGWVNKTKYSYWNLLADEFLRGRLYLSAPPQNNTHDLTFYNGNWYVPSPPLAAVLMIPMAYLVGGENISTADFSMVFSAVNAALVFLVLDQLVIRQWIKLPRISILWLVLLFAFGTPHLWVGISGRFWFVSQVITVTFLALAVFASIRSWSPWLIGIFIGMAVCARPNGLMSWPFVFAITMQVLKEDGRAVDIKGMFVWSLKSALPILIAVLGLLLYNHARFDNYFDFGYITIDGDPAIVRNAKTYGLFSTYYIPKNLQVMFLYLPKIQWDGQWPILPSGAGMSIFLTTPPLIYLFRRYENKWWILGAWTAVLCNLLLLILYHNTGRDQFGYRYILDALVPLTVLLAAALGKKPPWHFKVLVILSVLINLYGANWFMNG